MKKLFFLIILALLWSCSGRNTIHIQGQFTGIDSDLIYLDEVNINASVRLDSATVKGDGSFRFKIQSEEPSFYQVKVSENNFITLLAEPGEEIFLQSERSFLPDAYSVEGSEGSSLLKSLDDRLLQTQKSLDSIVTVYKENMNSAGFDTLEPVLNEKYAQVITQQRRFTIRFILENLTSLVNIKALYQKYDSVTYVLYDIKDLQYLKIVSDSLKVYYPDSKHTKALVADLNNEMERFNAERMRELVTSSDEENINVSLPTPEGDTIQLSSLRGKYVLISFWASWNEASVRQNVELKKIYNQYKKNGFEIYQISFDSDAEAWKKAIEFDEIPWINVSDLLYPNSPVVSLFNVQNLPANYLLDVEGTIIGKDFTTRTLKIKLSQLFD